jgi:hypothetical protein
MNGCHKVLLACLVGLALFTSLARSDAEEPELDGSATQDDESGSEQPIAVELAQGIDLLNTQIATQQQLLKAAQTERERQLIHNHIRLLQKERRSLEGLLHRLVGPDFDVLEATREQQSDHRAERYEKTLEKDERFPSP